MTTRELLEQQLAGYDDDMEPSTPKPRVELKSDGSTFTLYRNGKPVSFWRAFGSEDNPAHELVGLSQKASCVWQDDSSSQVFIQYISPVLMQPRFFVFGARK